MAFCWCPRPHVALHNNHNPTIATGTTSKWLTPGRVVNQLIACRALQGIGGSGMQLFPTPNLDSFSFLADVTRTGLYSLTMVILPEVSPAKFRQALGGVIGIVVAVGGVLGPVLGGMPPRAESPFR